VRDEAAIKIGLNFGAMKRSDLNRDTDTDAITNIWANDTKTYTHHAITNCYNDFEVH
jgi:hypothetical protein